MVGGLATHFMIDPATYQAGAELGFAGLDFYVVGRGGALGEVHADVVVASFVFLSPARVVESWDRGRTVMPATEAADHFISLGHRWAEEHLSDDRDLERLAQLLGTVVSGANPAAAPLFAAWRTRPEPGADRPKALVLHRMNLLRELRGALHGAAVLAHGISPHEAVSIKTPVMLGIFGYDGPHPDAARPDDHPSWTAAEAATDRAMAPAFATLTEDERIELVALLDDLHPLYTG